MEEFPYHQPPSLLVPLDITPYKTSIAMKTLQAFDYLVDEQAKVLEKLTVKGA